MGRRSYEVACLQGIAQHLACIFERGAELKGTACPPPRPGRGVLGRQGRCVLGRHKEVADPRAKAGARASAQALGHPLIRIAMHVIKLVRRLESDLLDGRAIMQKEPRMVHPQACRGNEPHNAQKKEDGTLWTYLQRVHKARAHAASRLRLLGARRCREEVQFADSTRKNRKKKRHRMTEECIECGIIPSANARIEKDAVMV